MDKKEFNKISYLKNEKDIKDFFETVEEIKNPIYIYCRFDLGLIMFSSEEIGDSMREKMFDDFLKKDIINPDNPDDEIIWGDDDEIDDLFIFL